MASELNGVNDLPEYRVFDFVEGVACSKGKFRLIVLGSEEKVILRAGKNKIEVEGVSRQNKTVKW